MKYLIFCAAIIAAYPSSAYATTCKNSGLQYRPDKSENLSVDTRCQSNKLADGDQLVIGSMGSLWVGSQQKGKKHHEVICQSYTDSPATFSITSKAPWLSLIQSSSSKSIPPSACNQWSNNVLSCSSTDGAVALFCSLSEVKQSEQQATPLLSTAITVRGKQTDQPVITNTTIQDNQHVAEVIRINGAAIKFCARKEQASGTVKMSWIIAAGGRTARIKVLDAQPAQQPIAECISQWVQRWSFPKIKRLNLRVEFAFSLDH